MPKRRGHGEGSIYQRKDGLWCAQVTTGRDATGRLKRRYVYGATRKEVQDKLVALLADAQKGLPIDPTKQTVGEFLTRWLEDSVKGSRAPKTYARYESIVRVHLIPALGQIPLTKLSPQHLQHLYQEKQNAGENDKAFKCHAVLRRALNLAVKWGLIPRNPANLVDAPRVKRKEIQVWTPEEAMQFLDAAREDKFYALYVLAVTCGLRLGELLGLKWEDIDFDAGTLQVRRQLQWIKGEGPQFVETKRKQSRRTVFLPTIAIAALQEHRKKQLEERLRLGEAWQDLNLVFCTEIGTPVNPSNIHRRSYHRILAKAGVQRIRIHDMRHTAASLLLAQGVHPRVVQEQLGHSQISITMDLYSHVLPSLKKQVAETMDSLFPAGTKKRINHPGLKSKACDES